MTDGRSDELRGTEPLVGQIKRVFPELVSRKEDGKTSVFVGGVLMALVRASGELEDRLDPVEAQLAGSRGPIPRRILAMDETAVGKIRQLRGVTWEWRDEVPDEVSENPGMGVIAQEVERVFPELVERTEGGYLAVHYYGLIGPLIEAVKELDDRLRVVEERVQRPGAR